jgi:hypothetical protein
MSFSTSTTAAKQVDTEIKLSELPKDDFRPSQPVNTDSTLPIHHVPPPRTNAPFLTHSETIPSSTNNNVATPSETNTWLSHIKEYAPVVGVIGTIIGVIVTIITVVIK